MRDFDDPEMFDDNRYDHHQDRVNCFVADLLKRKGIKNISHDKLAIDAGLGYLARKYPFIVKNKEEDDTGITYLKKSLTKALANKRNYVPRGDLNLPGKGRGRKRNREIQDVGNFEVEE